MALAGFATYLELASYFPNRSGSEVVYLEQAYPRPKYLFPITYAVQSVILSFASSNAIVMSRYVWRIANKTPSDWQMKGVAVAAYTLAVICAWLLFLSFFILLFFSSSFVLLFFMTPSSPSLFFFPDFVFFPRIYIYILTGSCCRSISSSLLHTAPPSCMLQWGPKRGGRQIETAQNKEPSRNTRETLLLTPHHWPPPQVVLVHNKYSLWAINVLGVVKITTLVFISITGLVVLGGHVPRVPQPGANFRDAFDGTTTNGNDLSTALVSIVFAYSGYANAFNVVNEIRNPVPSIKRYGFVSVLYMLCNVAYFAAVDKAAFARSKEVAAGVFFTTVFGASGAAETAFSVLVLLSAFGNLVASLVGQSRMIREIGRQGVLPWTGFWIGTRPFGTPIGPYALKWVMTFIMIVAPPAGDAFQFVVSLRTYPEAMFGLAMAVGVFVIRKRRSRNRLPRSQFRVWNVFLVFYNVIQVFLLVMPWWPPKGGPYAGDVSFWYATYCVTGIGM